MDSVSAALSLAEQWWSCWKTRRLSVLCVVTACPGAGRLQEMTEWHFHIVMHYTKCFMQWVGWKTTTTLPSFLVELELMECVSSFIALITLQNSGSHHFVFQRNSPGSGCAGNGQGAAVGRNMG